MPSPGQIFAFSPGALGTLLHVKNIVKDVNQFAFSRLYVPVERALRAAPYSPFDMMSAPPCMVGLPDGPGVAFTRSSMPSNVTV